MSASVGIRVVCWRRRARPGRWPRRRGPGGCWDLWKWQLPGGFWSHDPQSPPWVSTFLFQEFGWFGDIPMDWKPPYGLIWSNEDGIGNRENNWMIIEYEKLYIDVGNLHLWPWLQLELANLPHFVDIQRTSTNNAVAGVKTSVYNCWGLVICMKTEGGSLANCSYNLYLLDAVACWMEGTFYYSTSGNLGHHGTSDPKFPRWFLQSCDWVFLNRVKVFTNNNQLSSWILKLCWLIDHVAWVFELRLC